MFGASLGSLSLKDLQPARAQKAEASSYRAWEDVYRRKWTWDKVAWVSHCVDCYPGNCPYRVYVKGGVALWEEQAGRYDTVEPGVPDMNPMGCQKGAGWAQMLHGKERVLYPMKRAGERGEGKWQRISWDEALTEAADAMIDAIQEAGPESIVHEMTGAQGGFVAMAAVMRFTDVIGGLSMDLDAVVNDFAPGMYLTFGKIFASSVDDWFHSDLIFIWHMNPAYTRVPYYHYVAEARYKGAEVITVAPDFSPSAVHADHYVAVRPGSDGALALGMCQTIVQEKLYKPDFMKEQTDLALLVRVDNRRYLRQSDLKDGGSEEQFYFFDTKTSQIVEAPRGSLALDAIDPALEGSYSAAPTDGRTVEVVPVFELVKERLQDYTPEKASTVCCVHPDTIRMLARKAAKMKANILLGFNSGKQYHGDLQERAISLLLGLTANWGKKGTGIRIWSGGPWPGMISGAKLKPGPEGTEEVMTLVKQMEDSLKAQDPTLSHELAITELGTRMTPQSEIAAPVFFWYYNCGYQNNWNKREWSDPTMVRPFDDYMREALDKGWWEGNVRPSQNTPTRVYIECGGDTLRRTRGGQTQLLKHLWPKLKMVVNIDWRMNTTGLFADIFLPCTTHCEKINFHYSTVHTNQLVFNDHSADVPGECKSEPEIFRLLCRKIEERAKARGFLEYHDSRGTEKRLDDLYDRYTLQGQFEEDEATISEWVDDGVVTGILPQGTTLETMREKGFVRFIDWGNSPMAVNQGSDLLPNETHCPLRHHTEKKLPYPTLTRRAQFYIDHDWFFEANEELPVHKDPPKMGGDYPFVLTTGHPRWSIHAANMINKIMLNTYQGRPFVFMNPDDALAKGIEEGDEIRVSNDMGTMITHARISPAVQTGQIISYNGFNPCQFKQWLDAANVEPGMVKWLHLAGGYGHLRFRPMCWQPVPIDRGVRVDVAKID
jgi:DMSO reductase family type II enzyme molybdopterin subunit